MRFFLFLIALTITTFPLHAAEINAKAAYLIHPQTGTVLYNQNGSQKLGPASLTKMMTLYVLFSEIESGRLTLESEIPVSEAAWRKGGSKMFIEVGKSVRVEDLIRGIAISSGNDACIAVAEHLGGTEDNFATMMNRKAKELGMSQTHFKNASGWPHPEQRSSAKDMTTLGAALRRDFPQFYKYFSEREFTYSDIKQANRNWLLSRGIGVDGIKTGHTEEDGYHLVSSGVRNGQRLVAAVLGTDSMAERANQSQALLNIGFAGGSLKRIIRPDQKIALNIPVHMGTKQSTALLAATGLNLYVNSQLQDTLEAQIVYESPLVAPVQAGTKVGTLTLKTAHQQFEIDVLTSEDIAKDSFFNRYLRHAGQKLGL